ncbi:MAG: response regulator [Pseudomonadales bacterium]|nr:response regulator [Pseudomonadales bacterium]
MNQPTVQTQELKQAVFLKISALSMVAYVAVTWLVLQLGSIVMAPFMLSASILSALGITLCLFQRYGSARFVFLAGVTLFWSSSVTSLVDSESRFLLIAALLPLPFFIFTASEKQMRLASMGLLVVVSALCEGFFTLGSSEPSWHVWAELPWQDLLHSERMTAASQGLTMIILASLIYILIHRIERSRESLRLHEDKLKAIVTSLNDVVFEINEHHQIVNVWTGNESNLPLARHVYENAEVKKYLPGAIYTQFSEAATLALTTESEQRFEYCSPSNGIWYEARVKKLLSNVPSDQRVVISLRNINDQLNTRKRLATQNLFVEKHWDAVVYTDTKGVVQFANEATYRGYGLRQDSLGSNSIAVLLGEKKYLIDLIVSDLQKRDRWQGETSIKRPDGELVRVGLTVQVLDDQETGARSLAWCLRDITEHKNAERALRLSEKRFKSMTVNAPGIIFEWVSSRDGTYWGFNYISPRVEEMFGLSPEKCMADAGELIQYIHPADFEGFAANLTEVTQNLSGWNYVARLILPGNDVRWFRCIATPIDCDDRNVVFHGILMDITQEVLSQAELLHAKERAELATQEKSNFLSTMSHEIRTPLNAVIGLSHLLLEDAPTKAQVENLTTLKFSAESLLSLINDILDFSKIEAGKIELEMIPTDLRRLVKSVLASLELQAEEKGIDLRCFLDPKLPMLVRTDPTRLSQILINLLSNAIKFTDRGYVQIVIKAGKSQGEKIDIEFRVKDTGIGIGPETQQSIFDFFNQADNSITRKYGGTGVGLAITKGLLDLFGSRMVVKSAIGQGAMFAFKLTLPLAKVSELEALPNQAEPESAGAVLRGCRVLLVEDNRVNVMVARKLLSKWGAEIDVADDGEAAIRMVQEQEYHIVLMDIQMPNMDGYEATRAIRQLGGKYKNLPILALTATVLEEVLQKTEAVGLNGVLSKPIRPGELKQQLSQYY